MNSYPLLDNKLRPIFTADLGDITPKGRSHRVIDISNSPLVPAKGLRQKLQRLHDAGELDGGLPVVRHGVLVGLIPAPDLEFALDKLDDEDQTLCLMAANITWHDPDDAEGQEPDPTDFTPYIDPVSFQEKSIPGEVIRVKKTNIFCSAGARGFGRSFPDGPCLPMFREVGLAIHLRAEGWHVRRIDPQEDLRQIHQGARIDTGNLSKPRHLRPCYLLHIVFFLIPLSGGDYNENQKLHILPPPTTHIFRHSYRGANDPRMALYLYTSSFPSVWSPSSPAQHSLTDGASRQGILHAGKELCFFVVCIFSAWGLSDRVVSDFVHGRTISFLGGRYGGAYGRVCFVLLRFRWLGT